MCLNIGTPKNINFSFETNGKLMALGVPILKHFRVYLLIKYSISLSSLAVVINAVATISVLIYFSVCPR